MIYVNTSLDVALDRNSKRERKVSTSIATKSWKDVQSNLGKFSQHFRRNMIVVDNNEVLEDDGTLFNDVLRQIKPLLKRKVTSPSANAWIEMEMKRRGITKKPKGW
jgi:thymidylate kinase